MDEIIKRWLQSGQINVTDIPIILTTFSKEIKNHDITAQELQTLMQLSPHINFDYAMEKIAHKFNYEWTEVLNAQGGLVCRLPK